MSKALTLTRISTCSDDAPSKLDLYGTPVKESKRREEVAKVQAGILNSIFGTKDVPHKRGSQRERWASYNKDLSVKSIVMCAMTALNEVVLPVAIKMHNELITEKALNEAVHNLQIDPKPELDKRFKEDFLPSFARQVGVLTTRKVFQSVIKSLCSEKFADKFCRDFYPKLRRTMKRYGNGFVTYSKIFSAASFIALNEHVPFLLYEVLVEMGSLYYQYSFNKIDSDMQEDLIDKISKKTQKMAYMVVQDASIRTLLVAVTAVFGSSNFLNFGMRLELPNELLFIAFQITGAPMIISKLLEAFSAT
jgi:hypothetical protein